MKPKLLPCPFCGGEATDNDGGNSTFGRFWWVVGCSECDVSFRDREVWNGGHLVLPPQECFERWNRRAHTPEVQNLKDKLMRLHDETMAAIVAA